MRRRTRRVGRRPAARAAAATVQSGADIEQLLEQPAFRVLTADRLNWINPYTGELIPAPFDYRDAAREVLRRERPWETGQSPMSLHRVQVVRWNHFLRASIRDEPRLRMFGPDGAWLNPYTGRWVTDVHRVDGKVGASTISEMATELAGCEAAAEGGEMLPEVELKRIHRETAQAAAEASQRLRSTGTGSLTPSGALPVIPASGTRPVAPSDTGSFGWTDLFGKDSPFDQTPASQSAASEEVLAAHKMLTEAGIDWAMHPGFDGGRSGHLVALQPAADGQVILFMARVANPGAQGVELCGKIRNELRFIGSRYRGFTATAEAVTEFLYEEFGDDHAVTGFLGLIDPAEHDLDALTIDSQPAIAAEFGNHDRVKSLGGKAPALGTMIWDEYRKHIDPTIIKLGVAGTVFAIHEEAYRVPDPQGRPLGRQAVWKLVAQLANERPKEVLSRVMALIHKHSGQRLRDVLPGVGMWAMRIRGDSH